MYMLWTMTIHAVNSAHRQQKHTDFESTYYQIQNNFIIIIERNQTLRRKKKQMKRKQQQCAPIYLLFR